MAWFFYKDQDRRRCRKGIWLRVRDLPKDVLTEITDKLKANETIAWVVVKELRPYDQVLLEIWCHQDKISSFRFTVFHILVDENPDWVCESDLGRGLVIKRKLEDHIKSKI